MKKILFICVSLLFPLTIIAQASGGQIRRPNRVQQTEQRSRQHNNTRNNHEFVDLGLSVKWATCNIGASKPHEYGNYFAWGETKPKSDYSWKTYFDLAGGSSNPHLSDPNYSFKKDDFIKFNRFTNLKFGIDYDAASVLWGSTWRTPSHENFNELWSLPHKWVCVNGVYGMEFTSSNGNSLFLPAAGGKKADKLDNVQEVAVYWMNELHEDDYDVSELAKMWLMDKDDGGWSSALRCFGFPIRPVTESSQNKEECDGNLYEKTGIHNGYDYVDLGLSVRWATCNVGANSPEGYGNYFAWGETSPRTDYGIVSQNSIRRDIGTNISGSAYDAAYANWGGNWRIPTRNEVQELIDNCKWKQARYNGTDGFCITGPNNKSIFIPAAGYYSEKKRVSGYFVNLWTATAELDSQYDLCWVYHLLLSKNIYQSPPVQPELIRESYYVGMCIRPVIN